MAKQTVPNSTDRPAYILFVFAPNTNDEQHPSKDTKQQTGGYGMNCWHCKTELIWGGDHDIDDDEEHSMVTNLSCPECESYVLVYYPRETEDET